MQTTRVIFLGTSSATPSRERNVSSLAMILDGHVLLFDCGEGTQHQLLRAPVRLGSLDAIFISHLHGDHVYGLPGLLATLSLNGRTAPLPIYGPIGLGAFVEATLTTSYHHPFFDVEVIEEGEHRGDRYSVTNAPLAHSIPVLGYRVTEDDRPGRFDVARARALGVPEGPLFGRLQAGEDVTVDGRVIRASDVVGPSRRGRRIAYCTDTRPCDAAVELAREADLLIHESTYGSELATEAHERFHSTSVEAARVAVASGAQHLVLTHFSTRYTDVTPLVEEARGVFPNTDAAADFACFDVPPPL
ncbi:MAG TPA: ribonuclease Z [Thermoanaerobaculia bacterium]|jgi:ribonuclease Z